MPRRALVLALLLALASLLFWLLRPLRPVATTASSQAEAGSPAVPSTAKLAAPPVAQGRFAEARVKRDALRTAITQALARAPANPALGEASPAPAAAAPDPPATEGKLRDRIGGRDALVRALNRQFMPLAQDCISRAQAENPSLHGMLALAIETLADEEHGAVVDVAAAAPNNEVVHTELWECIRESAYSLSLPPPPGRGREAFVLTLPLEPTGDLGTGPPPPDR